MLKWLLRFIVCFGPKEIFSDSIQNIIIFQYLYFLIYVQEREPKCPTVVPVSGFNPEEDAAEIETAIKTKGMGW